MFGLLDLFYSGELDPYSILDMPKSVIDYLIQFQANGASWHMHSRILIRVCDYILVARQGSKLSSGGKLRRLLDCVDAQTDLFLCCTSCEYPSIFCLVVCFVLSHNCFFILS